ncbi:unnamed protein product [Zymoseptoria tritici ST99CH_3D1]|nr:unnamed protein product [Zymoseptoria tritici ST99CH_3D1]
METVLVIGSTGNIGVAAVTAALRSNRDVLAVVRNQESAGRLVKHIISTGIVTPEEAERRITVAEADVISQTGVKAVVDRVRAGTLPAFHHVWSSVGGDYVATPLLEITLSQMRHNFNASFEANFFAYQATMPYLLEQNSPVSTWTSCTGAQGELAMMPVPAMPQGALFSFATAASRENEATNVRFNEVYLAFRVEVDEQAVQHGVTKASDFAKVYEMVLADSSVRSSRVRVESVADIETLRCQKKF